MLPQTGCQANALIYHWFILCLLKIIPQLIGTAVGDKKSIHCDSIFMTPELWFNYLQWLSTSSQQIQDLELFTGGYAPFLITSNNYTLKLGIIECVL